ncbi:cell wall hydrolase [Erythrobacter dokdonensis]|uniref:Cell wall hydrolase, SleB n=1 Tax=Erythrobacter dokdonensis DSW-74 TaxID=1300349 RepID=A0A1A7BIM4_9SPHN|nr:cell wall hydrolase [Erythrobacter dokdonensis]OBV12319.1 Cell wall hydrolase, SleB [Erythrobacter dokdonensis DSW-74]
MPLARAPFASIASLAAAIPVSNVWRKRLAVLAAAIAVPALAAPGNIVALPGPALESTAATDTRQAAATALPFERPGMSFPGSAFYYLADPPGSALVALPKADPLSPGAEDGRELGALIDVGAPARPFFSAGTGITHMRAQECLAQAVWYEAASESEAGQRAVAQVVLNRVAHPSWPASVCGVVYQGSERRTGCQFTFTCDGSLARRPSGTSWARAQRVAAEALSGSVYAPVGHATHYHTLWVNPYWAGTLDHVGTIGAHRFYRLRGGAGEKNAFSMAYAGLESGPAAAPALSQTAAAARPAIAYDLAPLTDNKRDSGRPASPADTAKAPASTGDPAYAAAGQVKPEYARAGQWKTPPAKAPAPAPEAAAD